MLNTKLDDSGKTVYVTAAGELSAKDYEQLTPELENLIDEHGKLNLLFDMSSVEDIDPGAAWRDLKFDTQHLTDFAKVAIVGDTGWEKVATKLGNPFTSAEVKYFGTSEKETAAAWIEG